MSTATSPAVLLALDQIEFLGRLRSLAKAECPKCAKNEEPYIGPHGLAHHGIWLCSAYKTHERIVSYLELPV